MSSGRHLGGIATAGTPGGGDDESGFRSQAESSRISPITGSRQSLIFGRRCLTMDIPLLRNDREPSFGERKTKLGVVQPSSLRSSLLPTGLKPKPLTPPVPVRYLFQNPQSRARQQLKTPKALRRPQ